MRRIVKMKPALHLVAFPTQYSQNELLHGHWPKPVGNSRALWDSVCPVESSCILFLVLLLQSEPGIICTRPDASSSLVALSHLCTTPMGRRWVAPILPFCCLYAMVSLKPGTSTGQHCIHLSFHGPPLHRVALDRGKVSKGREMMKTLTL